MDYVAALAVISAVIGMILNWFLSIFGLGDSP